MQVDDPLRAPLPRRPLWRRSLPWFAGLVPVAGTVALLVEVVPNQNPIPDSSATKNSVLVSREPPKTVPLAREARIVGGRFILTAVQRKHLDQAWELSGPPIRQGQTYKEWLTGSIAVTPFLPKLQLTPMKIDRSYRNYALLEVALLPKSKNVKGEYFWLELRRVGKGPKAQWLVWSWIPRDAPSIRSRLN